MKVKYIGFGGYMEVPCYQDENGKIYFDENNGRNGLNLYTGAYMDCGEICGEPCSRVTEPVECENPFVRSSKEREYMLLNRLQLDCKYYINCAGKCRSSSLWADIDTIIKEMENIMDSFTEEEKPEWLTDADFEALKNEIMATKTEREGESMKLSESDKSYFKKCGYIDQDIPQIEKAIEVMQYEDENDKKVSRKYVLDNMDRETWLSGIGRAAFHWSATRETKDGKTIFFDARKLFK